MTVFSVFLIETTIILFVVLVIVVVFVIHSRANGSSGKKKTEAGKKEPEKKETKVIPKVPRKVTFWTDWKTWVMFALGYLLWWIANLEQIFNGGPFYQGVAKLPDGMLYLPITGIFYAAILCTFIYLAMHSKSPFVVTFGLVFGIVCVFASLSGHWFYPYGYFHVILNIGKIEISSTIDPMIESKWIGVGVFCTYMLTKALPKKGIDSDIIGVMVLVLAAIIFIPQLFYL